MHSGFYFEAFDSRRGISPSRFRYSLAFPLPLILHLRGRYGFALHFARRERRP